jgi:prepilin-type processing-associated H-X9-DG protein
MRARITAILLVLFFLVCGGLLTSTILQIREASQRLQCLNNLKQIGLSSLNFHSAYRRFPSAAVPNTALLPEKRLSWLVAVLPMLESTDQFVHLQTRLSWDAEENCSFASFPHYSYQCPMRYPEQGADSGLAPTTYIGIAGVGTDAAALPTGDPKAGYFGYERELTQPDIERRASTLLLAAETSHTTGSWLAAGPATIRGLEPNNLPFVGVGRQFGGLHRGGANVLFADGSARALSDSVEPRVFEALAKVAGERVRLDD